MYANNHEQWKRCASDQFPRTCTEIHVYILINLLLNLSIQCHKIILPLPCIFSFFLFVRNLFNAHALAAGGRGRVPDPGAEEDRDAEEGEGEENAGLAEADHSSRQHHGDAPGRPQGHEEETTAETRGGETGKESQRMRNNLHVTMSHCIISVIQS